MEREVAKSLQKIGVDTRFVSITDKKVFINNLKLSKFSRRKEELFKNIFPEIDVVRSKIFQKICMRASRNLAHCISPKERIFLNKDGNPANFTLNTILEPYKRKYGVEFIFGNDIDEAIGLNVDSIALPITLDDEAENILNSIINGQKIDLISSNNAKGSKKLIYPLVNVPRSWIHSWRGIKTEISHERSYDSAEDLLLFLENLIPDVRENLFKSGLFLQKSC